MIYILESLNLRFQEGNSTVQKEMFFVTIPFYSLTRHTPNPSQEGNSTVQKELFWLLFKNVFFKH